MPQPFLNAGGWVENLWRAFWPGSPMSQQPSMTEWTVRARGAWPRHLTWLLPTPPTGVHDCQFPQEKRARRAVSKPHGGQNLGGVRERSLRTSRRQERTRKALRAQEQAESRHLLKESLAGFDCDGGCNCLLGELRPQTWTSLSEGRCAFLGESVGKTGLESQCSAQPW